MYIKQIIINGFKSYKEQTTVEFDKGYNVIVGHNGSGKSNFFNAIEFVLSKEYSRLTSEHRQNLLHASTGGEKCGKAFVELILDNSDSRIPVQYAEVHLRRVIISANKDQYYLNRKVMTKTEITNLLETAGLSFSNPYNIIKQGKINELATASDGYILNLLLDIAGIKYYNEKISESQELLRGKEIQLKQLDEMIVRVETRSTKLTEESEELKQYENYNKIRRTLEHIIYEKENKENKLYLARLAMNSKESEETQTKLIHDLKNIQDDIKKLSKKTKISTQLLKTLEEEDNNLKLVNQQLIEDKVKLKLTINELSENINQDKASKHKAENELARLNQDINHTQSEFNKVNSQYQEMKRREEDCKRNLNLKEQQRRDLYMKQNRANKFASREERDRWIKNELESLNKQLKEKKDYLQKLEEGLKQDNQNINELNKKIEEKSKILDKQKEVYKQKKQFYDFSREQNLLQTKKNEMYGEENKIQSKLSLLKDNLVKADQKLYSLVGKQCVNGIDSVRKVLDTFIQRGGEQAEIVEYYYGMVIDNFKCEKIYYTCVEVTAKNKLFYHIVDTDKIGTKILKEMNRQKLPGEVNFIAMNRLNVRVQDYPNDDYVLPMISKLDYDQKYDKVMRLLFGRTLICRTMEIASISARKYDLNCITAEGDQVTSRGALTGGYFNRSNSRLETQNIRKETIDQIQQCENELNLVRSIIEKNDSDINNIVSNIQKMETEQSKVKFDCENAKVELRLIQETLDNIKEFQSSKELAKKECKSNMEIMQSTIESLENELHQELLQDLSVHDREQINSLNDEILQLQREYKDICSARLVLESENNKLNNLLNNNLIRQREKVSEILEKINLENKERQIESCKLSLKRNTDQFNKNTDQIAIIKNKITDLMGKMETDKNEFEILNKKNKEIQQKLDEEIILNEKFVKKQELIQEKNAANVEKINELGPIPSQRMYADYIDMSTRKLHEELQKTNGKLKKYASINKKAIVELEKCAKIKTEIQTKKKEIDQSLNEINELFSVFEEEKNKTIQYTLNQISENFRQIFKKMIPTGKAKLVIKTPQDEEGHEIQISDNLDDIIGIGIKVSFIDAEVEMKQLNQLSGGQKSLVALALIFAIQKCNPSSFYVFDEIDQALDPAHRSIIAKIIHELSADNQFLITTFRPELLEPANKVYGIEMRNNVSHITSVARETAINKLKSQF